MATMGNINVNNSTIDDDTNDNKINDKACRYIYNDIDMKHFLESSTKKDLLRVITAIGKSCSSAVPVEDGSNYYYEYNPQSPLKCLSVCMASLHGSLRAMEETWIQDFPPASGTKAGIIRFGNPSFRKWHDRLTQRSRSILSSIFQCKTKYNTTATTEKTIQEAWESGYQAALSDEDHDTESTTMTTTTTGTIISELCCYLEDSFGHPVRLDYGTGHESSFMVLLYCLCKVGCIDEHSTKSKPPGMLRLKATTLSLFHQYLKVTRKLQTLYMLEPAGSHGVWGLDDYHCLPFYFGACQLQELSSSSSSRQQHSELESPNCIHDRNIMMMAVVDDNNSSPNNQENSLVTPTAVDKYLYLGCIHFITQLKQGVPFFEHSPMLMDISQLASWSKVSTGLLRLYEGEVLNKRQVVQHFKFGNLFQATWTPSSIPKEAPTTTFRTTIGQNNNNNPSNNPLPPTRAPWAK